MTKLLKYLKPYIWQLILLIVLTYVQVMTSLKLPDYMSMIINKGIVGMDNNIILHTGIDMLLVSLLGGVCMIGVGYLASKIAVGFGKDIRLAVFSKIEKFSLVEFNKFSTASLITRSTNDIQQIQTVLIMLLRMVLMSPIMAVGAIIKAYGLAPHMTWIMAWAMGIMFVVIMVLFFVAMPKFKILQKMVDKLNLITRQILTGLRVIRAFNNEKKEEKNFDNANTDLTNVSLFVNRLMALMQPLMMLIFNFVSLTVIWVGARQIDLGNLAVGDMMAFMQYSMQAVMSFLMFAIIFIMIPRASVSGERIGEILSTELLIKDPKKPVIAKETTGKVDFKNVYFSYPGADVPVLQDINFTAESGHITAIIGSTGSGKSTLINLIPRFYDVTDGSIIVDGVDIKNLKQEDLWNKIGYVPQKGVLFSGDIETNIKYGAPDASIEEITKAAGISQAMEFIDQSPEKFKNPIAQGGTNISGGQKQRLSIARAIIRKPEIYIFDDSFSALDFKTDAALRKSLMPEIKNKTVIIVAQRISTILNADKIIVLDEGKIVGIGQHQELLKNCKVYQEIASSQLTEEELSAIDEKRSYDVSMKNAVGENL